MYARALNETLARGIDPYDGRKVFDFIKDRPYPSALGHNSYIDGNGDAEGNYTLIARKQINGTYGIYPIGVFQMPSNSTFLPVSEENHGYRQQQGFTYLISF